MTAWSGELMPKFTGKSIDLNLQRALEDAMRQAMVNKAETVHEKVMSVEVTRIYSERHGEGSFNTVYVEIEAK
jgi:hypothetical protein